MSIKFGDYVTSSRHEYTGRVYGFEQASELDQGWIDMQRIPLTAEDLAGNFVRILIHEGGSVSVPESSCQTIDPIENFEHPYASEHFKELVNYELNDQVYDKIKMYVINQARYQYPSDWITEDDVNDRMYAWADTHLTDEQTEEFLKDELIIRRPKLLELANKIGLDELFSGDAGWVDNVADYIVHHRRSCMKLWDHISEESAK